MNINLVGQQLGAGSGIVASFLIVAGQIMSDMNDDVSVSTSSKVIAETFIKNQSDILVGAYLTLLGIFFLIFFLGYLRTYLLTTTDEKNWLVSVSFGGGLVTCAMLLLAAHFSQAFTVLDYYGGETQVAKALYVLEWNWYLLVEAPALAAFVGATTAVGFSNKLFPWWLNGWGVLLTLILLSPMLPGSGVMVTFLWVIVLSLLLLLRTRKTTI